MSPKRNEKPVTDLFIKSRIKENTKTAKITSEAAECLKVALYYCKMAKKSTKWIHSSSYHVVSE